MEEHPSEAEQHTHSQLTLRPSKPSLAADTKVLSTQPCLLVVAMDKILAFSIMSSSPAEIAGPGYATRLYWRSGGTSTKQQEHEEKVEQSSRPEKKKREVRAPRFAPEFDGVNCFESIVI